MRCASPDPMVPASTPYTAYPDPKNPMSKWPGSFPFRACTGLFPGSIPREGTKWLVYSLLNPRDGQSLYKQAELYSGAHGRCQVMQTRTVLGEKANRLRAGAWDLKELKISKVEPDLPCTCEYIFIMIGGWIIFCHLQRWNIYTNVRRLVFCLSLGHVRIA